MEGTYYMTGVAYWAKVHKPDEKFNKFTLDFYPDDKSWKVYKATGLQLKERESEHGTYIKLGVAAARLTKTGEVKKATVTVLDEDNNPTKEDIGNGSEVTVKIEVFDTAKGPGHRLIAVRADKLVAYKDVKKVSDDSIVPDMPF